MTHASQALKQLILEKTEGTPFFHGRGGADIS